MHHTIFYEKSSRCFDVTQFHVSLDFPGLLVVFQRDNSTALRAEFLQNLYLHLRDLSRRLEQDPSDGVADYMLYCLQQVASHLTVKDLKFWSIYEGHYSSRRVGDIENQWCGQALCWHQPIIFITTWLEMFSCNQKYFVVRPELREIKTRGRFFAENLYGACIFRRKFV